MLLLILAWIGGWKTTGISKQRNIELYFTNDGISLPLHATTTYPEGLYSDGKTYIVWQTLDPYIIYWNHNGGYWSYPIKVGINPLTNDDHGAPCIIQDTLGYFHVFYGCHNSWIQQAKSTNPNDITAWTDKGNIGSGMGTYLKAVLNDGNIYVFFRHGSTTDGDAAYIKSTDGGENWTSAIVIVDFGGGKSTGYASIHHEEDSSRVHYAWNMFDTPDLLNIYHAYLNLSNNKMYSMDGTDLGLKISEAEANANCLVYNSGMNQTILPAVHTYSGIPYIIFSLDVPGITFKFTKWNGLSWDVPQTITTTDYFTNTYEFIVHNASNIEAYLVIDGYSGRGGDIERWDWNGVDWNKIKTVLAQGGEWKALADIQIIKNYDNRLKLIFTEIKEGDYSTQLKVFAYGNEGFVKKEY